MKISKKYWPFEDVCCYNCGSNNLSAVFGATVCMYLKGGQCALTDITRPGDKKEAENG